MADEIISTNVDEIGDFWTREVCPFVKPIVEADPRQAPSPIGTAVLIAFREKQYLLTAKHVLADHIHGRALGAAYTFLPEQTEIRGPFLTVDDPFDLALVELSMSAPHPLKVQQHLALEVRNGEMCLFVGLQARTKSWDIDVKRNTLRPAPLSYLGQVCNSSPERFSIRFNEKNLRRSGVKQPPVGKLNGISGCGVWVLRNDMPKLAGIIIEYHRRQSKIIATNSRMLWEMLKKI